MKIGINSLCRISSAALVATLGISCSNVTKDGTYTLHVLSTNDVHGTWFDSTYVGGGQKKSIFAMNHYIDSVRNAVGEQNVVLVDAGDCLQGDNATYYYNYIDTTSEHLFPRLIRYMKYDAVAVGNHDVETGHPVYDRVAESLRKYDSPFLAGNAIRLSDNKPYFPVYKIVKRAGLKIAILGYTNANIKAWITEELYSGMTFEPIRNIIQRDVDEVRAKEKPDVLIAAMHSGCGQGDGTILEAEALDIFNSVRGIDFLVCGHDHRAEVETRDSSALLNSGSHSRYVAHGTLDITIRKGQPVEKVFSTELIPVNAKMVDTKMRDTFRAEFEAVRKFTVTEIGVLNTPLRTRDAFTGVSDYLNLIHTVGLLSKPAEISIAAPLTFNGNVKNGILIYNDLFTIYPYENQLYIVKMTGEEIQRYLEASYDKWINTISSPSETLLKIVPRSDPRSGAVGWSFVERSYNFDSAGGINYTVDVTKPRGERIAISSMANGAPFDMNRTYNVAMTSYRASGGGNLMRETGIGPDELDERTVEKYPQIRDLIYDYLMKNGSIDPEVIGDPKVVGYWEFVPRKFTLPALERDMERLFKR